MKPALNQYIHKVSAYLPCGWKAKKQILTEIRTSLSAYLEQHPDTTCDQILQLFGTPQQIAASYVDEMDTAELLRSLRIRRRIITCVILAIVAALIIFNIFFIIVLIIASNSQGGLVL